MDPKGQKTTEVHPLVIVSPYELHHEQRRYRRVDSQIDGRFLTQSGEEGICRLVEVSVGNAVMRHDLDVTIGERVVIYAEHIGRVEADVRRVIDKGTAVEFVSTKRRRDRIASNLMWLINRPNVQLEDGRRHARQPVGNASMTLVLTSGEQVECEVLDLSLSGAAVGCARELPLGTEVALGRMNGRIVRQFEGGYGIQFSGDLAALSPENRRGLTASSAA